MAKLKTNEQFIKECTEVHGNKYDYSETFYTGAHNVITIICPIHGSFQQKAYSHVQGCGCLECAGIKKLKRKRINYQQELIVVTKSYSHVVMERFMVKNSRTFMKRFLARNNGLKLSNELLRSVMKQSI